MLALLRGLVMFLILLMCPMLLHAATRRVELLQGDLTLFDQLTGAVIAKSESVYGRMMAANGVDPTSNKGRLILAWVIRISRDINIADSVHRMGNASLNPGVRTKLMSGGLHLVPPPLRLQYVELVSHFLDTLVPFDCFGLNDMSEVLNRIPMSNMSEAQIDVYFRVLLAALRASETDAEQESLGAQQLARADEGLRRSLLHELGYLQANVARYATYAQDPTAAAPIDACWAMRVTMHAMLALPDPERDIVLRRTFQSQHGTR
ncbi:hypothetical protein AWB74_08168 [Caballeronia arvi]|uniref:Uncharacterized protein n=1 Tax=Caballeronia arvi TaxID=1777135 RepID=A0A158L2U8_9BURK|nr:hypothetical protein [Caballeronia arvi]SAL87565.1 hypothetical protein AWB74_08168 [Caballeronia arvi]